MSVMRRIFMFPLTRLLLAVLIMLLMGFLLGVVWSVILGFGIDFLAGQTISALAALVALLFIGRVVERRSLAEIGLGLHRAGRELLLGFGIGVVLMSVVIGVLTLVGWYRVLDISFVPGFLGWALLLFLLVSVAEEIIFRGLLFRIVEEGLGSWLALLISALVFGLVHITNPNATLLAGIAIALEAGILFGAAYMLTRRLWLAIGIHWSWNFMQGPIFGVPVSGLPFEGVLQSELEGPEYWTGGAFGPEAGLVAIILATGTGIALLAMAVRRGHVVTPAWMRRIFGWEQSQEAVSVSVNEKS
jgi:membrane protease YdiL (CAAX protease family)